MKVAEVLDLLSEVKGLGFGVCAHDSSDSGIQVGWTSIYGVFGSIRFGSSP